MRSCAWTTGTVAGGLRLRSVEIPGAPAAPAGGAGGEHVPQIAIVAPISVRFQQFGLLNTYQALIIPYNSFALLLAIWVLTSYFRSMPSELEDASRVDGSTRLGALFRVILPLSAPRLFTTAILVFIAA